MRNGDLAFNPDTVTRKAILDAVLTAYDTWGPGEPVGGEWAAIRQLARSALYGALAAGDRATLGTILFDPVGRLEWSGLQSVDANTAHDMQVWRTRCPGIDSRILAYPRPAGPGEPSSAMLQDAPRHYAEAARLLAVVPRPQLVVEIGGGLGGLARYFHALGSVFRYVDIDLADTLYLAYAVLAVVVGLDQVRLGYDPATPICLVPSHAIPDLQPDLVLNYRSFSEMDQVVLERYFGLINTWQPARVVWENVGSRIPRQYPEILLDQFPTLLGYTLAQREASPWSISSRYVREEWVRE